LHVLIFNVGGNRQYEEIFELRYIKNLISIKQNLERT